MGSLFLFSAAAGRRRPAPLGQQLEHRIPVAFVRAGRGQKAKRTGTRHRDERPGQLAPLYATVTNHEAYRGDSRCKAAITHHDQRCNHGNHIISRTTPPTTLKHANPSEESISSPLLSLTPAEGGHRTEMSLLLSPDSAAAIFPSTAVAWPRRRGRGHLVVLKTSGRLQCLSEQALARQLHCLGIEVA